MGCCDDVIGINQSSTANVDGFLWVLLQDSCLPWIFSKFRVTVNVRRILDSSVDALSVSDSTTFDLLLTAKLLLTTKLLLLPSELLLLKSKLCLLLMRCAIWFSTTNGSWSALLWLLLLLKTVLLIERLSL